MTQQIHKNGSMFGRSLAFLLALLLLLVGLATSTQAAGAWTATGETVYGPMSHPAALLADGRVLVPGGTTFNGSTLTCSLDDAQLFDPATNTWSATAEMGTSRALHTATTLDDGRVLVTGGVNCTIYVSTTYDTAEIFDPATGAWTATGSMNTARSRHTATLLSDGRVLVVGGNFGGAAAEVFDPATGTWSATGSMTASHSSHTATLLNDGRVLVVSKGVAELFDPVTNTWTAADSLNTVRSSHTATLLNDGRVLAVGGQDSDGTSISYFDSAEIFDPATGTWTATGNMSTGRSRHAATLLTDGQVLVAGGTNGPILASAEVFDPATDTWTATDSMIDGRRDHTSTLLDDGRVLTVGGEGDGVCCAELFTLSGSPPPTPTPTATPPPTSLTLYSNDSHDGDVRELNNTNTGNEVDNSGNNILVGDRGNSTNEQMIGIVSFDTSAIPANATITGVTLRLQQRGNLVNDPFGDLGVLYADIAPFNGFGGSYTLESSDFEAPAAANNVISLSETTANDEWSTGDLGASHFNLINRNGFTQFKIHFQFADDNDRRSDLFRFSSSDDGTNNQPPAPELIVTYTVP